MDTQQVDHDALAQAVLRQLAAGGVTQKAAGTTPTTIYGHGPGGLFSDPGVNPGLVAAFGYPVNGLASLLPLRKSVYSSELFAILTGQTATTGTQPTTPCADCIQPGNLKECQQVLGWGQECMDSQVLEVTKAGRLRDRADMLDYRLLGNDPLAKVPDLPMGVTIESAFKSESKKKIYEMMGAWPITYGKRLYTGNPANTPSNEGDVQYRGLDLLINTGYQDAKTGTDCPAADSLIQSFGSLSVTSNPTTAVNYITEIFYYLNKLAEDTGNAPVTYVLAMRHGLFRALTEIWPCSMLTYRCVDQLSDTNASVNIDGTTQNALRQEMRAGNFLWIDGRKVLVVVDDAIAETQSPAYTFESDIYFIPLKFAGNQDGIYWEFFDLNAGAQEVINDFAPGQYRISPSGQWIINFKPSSNWCVQIGMRTLKRLILRVPFLAARLTDLQYTYTLGLHERTWWNDGGSDGSFYVDGGLTSQIAAQQTYMTPTN